MTTSHETFALNLCKVNAELQLGVARRLLNNAQQGATASVREA